MYLWGCIYTVVVILADSITFLVGSVLTSIPAYQRLYEEQNQIGFSFLYLLVCIGCVCLLSHRNGGLFQFPRYIQIIYLLCVVLGSLTVEYLLELLINVDTLYFRANAIIYFSIGFIYIILILMLLLLKNIGQLHQKNMELIQQNRQKAFEEQQFNLLSHTTDYLRTWRHDQQNHIVVLKTLLEGEQWEKAASYLDSMGTSLQNYSWLVQTGNSAIDATLSVNLPIMREKEIDFTYTIYLPEKAPLTDFLWTALLGNLMDNAITACCQIKDGKKRFIHLEIKPQQQFLYLKMTNSSSGKYKYNDLHQIVSTKSEMGHGIGLRRIQQIVEQNLGVMELHPGEESFEVDIILNLQKGA